MKIRAQFPRAPVLHEQGRARILARSPLFIMQTELRQERRTTPESESGICRYPQARTAVAFQHSTRRLPKKMPRSSAVPMVSCRQGKAVFERRNLHAAGHGMHDDPPGAQPARLVTQGRGRDDDRTARQGLHHRLI